MNDIVEAGEVLEDRVVGLDIATTTEVMEEMIGERESLIVEVEVTKLV